MKLEFSGQILEKYFNIKFYENPSSGSRVVTFGRADGQYSLFAIFENAPKNESCLKKATAIQNPPHIRSFM